MKAILKYKRKTGRVLKQKEIKIEQIPIKEEENFEKKVLLKQKPFD